MEQKPESVSTGDGGGRACGLETQTKKAAATAVVQEWSWHVDVARAHSMRAADMKVINEIVPL